MSIALALSLMTPRSSRATGGGFGFTQGDAVIFISTCVGIAGTIGSIVTLSGNGATFPAATEPFAESARGWAIADIAMGGIMLAVSSAAFAGMAVDGERADYSFGFGVALPALVIGSADVWLGTAALDRLAPREALRVAPMPILGLSPGGEPFYGVGVAAIGW